MGICSRMSGSKRLGYQNIIKYKLKCQVHENTRTYRSSVWTLAIGICLKSCSILNNKKRNAAVQKCHTTCPWALASPWAGAAIEGWGAQGRGRCGQAMLGVLMPAVGQPASAVPTTGGPLPLPSLYHLVLLMLEKLPKLWSNLLLSPQGKFPYFPPGLWGL